MSFFDSSLFMSVLIYLCVRECNLAPTQGKNQVYRLYIYHKCKKPITQH